jgi:hypothetical protein
MADTSKLKKEVEDWYRKKYLQPKKKDIEITQEKVMLKWGGFFEFDAVIKEGNRISEVHCLSTSKYNPAQMHKIKDDALMLTAVSKFIKKVIAFTDNSLYSKVKEQQENGRFPLDIKLIPLENDVPKEIKDIIKKVKEAAINEVR